MEEKNINKHTQADFFMQSAKLIALRLTVALDIKYFRVLNLHVCVLNRHAVWYGDNAAQCVDSTRMQVIVFQTAASMCLELRFMFVL
jgi:hypothetical protein